MAYQTDTFIWAIKDPMFISQIQNSKHGDQITSPYFQAHGFRWNLYFVKEDKKRIGQTRLYLRVIEFPSQLSEITVVRETSINELNIHHAVKAKYSSNCFTHSWSKSTLLPYNDTLKVKQLTIVTKITLLKKKYAPAPKKYAPAPKKRKKTKPRKVDYSHLYPEYERSLKSLVISIGTLKESLKIIKSKIHRLVRQIAIETKSNYSNTQNMSIMSSGIITLSNDIKMLQEQSTKPVGVGKSDLDIVKNWFNNDVKLPQYFDLFVEHGFDSLDLIQLIKAKQLRLMGITKIGHQMTIILHCGKLGNHERDLTQLQVAETDHYGDEQESKFQSAEHEYSDIAEQNENNNTQRSRKIYKNRNSKGSRNIVSNNTMETNNKKMQASFNNNNNKNNFGTQYYM